jgi:hypothetical protein
VSLPYLTDDEVDDICAGLKQNAAKVRFLQSLGLRVQRKPNGRPLVSRTQYDAMTGKTQAPAGAGPVWGVH